MKNDKAKCLSHQSRMSTFTGNSCSSEPPMKTPNPTDTISHCTCPHRHYFCFCQLAKYLRAIYLENLLGWRHLAQKSHGVDEVWDKH
mmetsp:Transcript_60917/g.163080  ORF Transcript_60917/g.163080 Transcript_60917/m.163080 type:complete len:87 (-) Transcript_60917:4960-5220(-)